MTTNFKISALPEQTVSNGNQEIPINDGGITRKIKLSNLAATIVGAFAGSSFSGADVHLAVLSPGGTALGTLISNRLDLTATSLQTMAGGLSLTTVTSSGLITAASLNTGAATITGGSITGMPTPVNSSDVATKGYVDTSLSALESNGIDGAATTGPLPSNTYTNGSAGVGAALIGVVNGALTVDGVAVTIGMEVLVKDEVTQSRNGLYTVTQPGDATQPYVLTRSTSMNTPIQFSGALVAVGSTGTQNKDTLWVCTPFGSLTIGSTAITFNLVNGTAGIVQGTGITISGNTLSANVTSVAGRTGVITLANSDIAGSAPTDSPVFTTKVTLPSWNIAPSTAVGVIGYNSVSGRYDFGIGTSAVNHVRLSGDTMTGALTVSSGAITAGGTGTGLSVTNNALVGGTLGVTGATTLGTLTATTSTFSGAVTLSASGTALSVTNNATISGVLTANSITASGTGTGLSVTTNALVGGTLGVTGAVTAPSISAANGSNLLISPGGNGHQIVFGDPNYGIGYIGSMTFASGAMQLTISGLIQSNNFQTPGNTITVSGSTTPTRLANFGANWAGSSTHSDNTSLAAVSIGCASDNLAFPNPGGARNELLIASNYGGNAFDGGRCGMLVQMLWNSASTVSSTGDGLVGYGSKVIAGVNAGGVSAGFGTTQFGKGSIFGGNPWANLATGATNFAQCVGYEIDGSIQTGASACSFALLQLVLTSDHATHGTLNDTGVALAAQVGAAVGVRTGVLFGTYSSQWPIDPNGYLIQAQSSENQVAATAAGGIDLLQFTASGSGPEGGGFAFRSAGATGLGATAIDGSGFLKIGTGYVSANSSGIIIDAPLYVLSGTPTIGSGGTNFNNTDVVVDGLGNVFRIATTAAGVVTSVTVMQRGEGRLTNPSGTIACTARVRTGATLGSGLTLVETWTQSSKTLSLNPSGGTTTLGGPLVMGSWTTSARPSSPSAGMFGYATDTQRFEFYDAATWHQYARLSGDTMTGALTINAGASGTGLTVSNNATITGTLSVTGTTTFSNALTTNGSFTANAGLTAHGSLTFADNTGSNPMVLKFDASNNLVLSTSVGGTAGNNPVFSILTNSATAPLVITPNVTLNGSLTAANSGNNIVVTAASPTATFSTNPIQLNSNMVFNNTSDAGTNGTTTFNGRFYTTINNAPNQFIWSLLSVLDYNGTGGTGEHVAVYGQTIRRSTPTAGGSAHNPALWAACLQNIDMSNSKSSLTNTEIMVEMDLNTNHVDDANNRQGISMVLTEWKSTASGGYPAEASRAYGINTSPQGQFKRIYDTGGNYGVCAIELRNAFDNGFAGGTRPTVTAAVSAGTVIPVSNVMPFTSDSNTNDVNGGHNATVFINGVAYTQTAYAFTGNGPAGTITISTPVTVAIGATVRNNSRAIWMSTGAKIAFDNSGNTNLSSDGLTFSMTGALSVAGATGGWGQFNFGKQFLVTTSGNNHPAMAIADSTGANLWAMINWSGALTVAAMPAQTDSSTPPKIAMQWLSSGGTAFLGAHADQSADVFVATAAGSRTIPNNCSWECLTPAGTIASFTTTMPATPIDKQDLWISTTGTITTWTLAANTGQTVNGAPTTLAANTSVHYRYNAGSTTWFRLA